MAKTYNQIKKSVLGKDYNINRNINKPQKTYSEIKSGVMNGKYNFDRIKSELEKNIRFDTLSNDLMSVGKTIGDTYGGWQTQETMLNTLSSVESMKSRLNALEEYQRLFGDKKSTKNDGISEIKKYVNSAIDNWDGLSKEYARYKNADAFSKAKKNEQLSEKFKGFTYDKVQEEKKKYKVGSDEYNFLDTYTEYNNLNDFNKALELGVSKDVRDTLKKYDDNIKRITTGLNNIRSKGEYDKNRVSYNKAIKEREEYIKSLGYENEDAFNKHLSFTNNLEIARNKRKLDHTFDLYEHYTKRDDFAENSKYISTEGNYDNWWEKFTDGQYGMGYGDLTYEYINNIDGMRDKIKSKHSTYNKDSISLFDNGASTMEEKGYDKLNPEEIATYNYIRKTEGEKQAKAFLDDMEINLTKRIYDEQTKRWKDNVDSTGGAILHSIASVPASVFGAIPTALDSISDMVQGKEYNPYSSNKTISNYASDTRKYVGENIAKNTDFEILGQNIPSFLYSTGMSLADNLLGANTLGAFYLPLMSTNAFHQKAKEMTEAGESEEVIYGTALASGLAEMVFEKISLDHFFKMKDIDGKLKLVKSALAQGGIELSEELGTEASNILTDTLIRGESSELYTKYKELLSRGFSESEIATELAKHVGSQIGWAGVGGFLSGSAMGGFGATRNYIQNSTIGKDIKAKERTQDLFDLANNPEIAEAYETYARWGKKGINAENVTNSQLGRLYNETLRGSEKAFNDKNISDIGRKKAGKTYVQLVDMATEDAQIKEAKENAKKFNVEDTSNVDIKTVKIKDGKVIAETKDGEISVDDIELSNNDANVVGYAEVIAKESGEDMANLFISQYDGKTSLEKYSTDFNLAKTYADKDFSIDHILKNKGSLTGDQVNNIYRETVIRAAKEKQDKLDKLNQEMADGKVYKAIINDSAIDYDNTSAEGKVNWKDLTSRQRKAVTFVKGFAQAIGMNLDFTVNSPEYNGKYNKDTNTITINLDNMNGTELEKAVDNIIPAMSHETTHWMKDKSPELWTKLNEVVFSTLVDHYNSNTDLKRKRELLKKLGERTYTEEELKTRVITEADLIQAEMNKGKTESVAREEIIARACEDMLKMSEEGIKVFSSLSESEQKSLVAKFKALIEDLLNWVKESLNLYDATSTEARIMRKYEEKLKEVSKIWDEMLVKSKEVNQVLEKSGAYKSDIKSDDTNEEFDSIGTIELSDFEKAQNIDGTELFQYKAMVEDEDAYRTMLNKYKDVIDITDKQINALFTMVDNAVDIISENLEALDYSWDEDINDRAFHPVKANSDKLYKVSLDFSTLCRKRLLQQTIQATLQEALNKQLSTNEAIAIRDELMKIQEEGRKIEVACALCYVESARMKSPEQIKKFIDNRENVIRDFFANRSQGDIKQKIKDAEMKARKKLAKDNPNGMVGKNGVVLNPLDAKLNQMSKSDADYIREVKKKAKAKYELTEHEQAELDAALNMSITDFTSAKGLEELAKKHSDIFDAYTSYIRNATHSKGLENDVWWRAGDSDAISDTLIEQMNAENGLRSQSWSDFQVIHLLDYIAATIELSTKKAKRQSYTKVPDYVKLLGNTGDMINMSVIPERVFSGKLGYDDVEGMAYKVACELRETYHETAGIICIGIDNDQIRLLLEDTTIDMVIPYHKSSMAKERRKLMHIPDWKDFEAYQNETTKLTDAEAKARAKEYGVKLLKATNENYQKSPKFSEWFNLEEARQIAKMENENPTDMKAYKKYGKMYGGYMAMQNAANNYLKLCAERGLLPKFAHPNADFSKDANYWKLLIDRKMVDNVTGEIIEQKAIKPIFNEKDVLGILNDELARYPQVKADQEYATRKVTEKFLSGEMKVDADTLEAIKKPVDNITNVNILESSKDMGNEVFSKKDSKKIAFGMSDSERADILRNKTIKDIPVVKEISADILEKFDNISSWNDINNFKGKDKRHLIRKIAQEFGVFKEYTNSDINISFDFSGNNFGESYGKQKRNYENFAKMFSVFDEVIEKAVGIEVHNRNNEGYKPDATLNNVYVLISAFEDGEWIIPVKLEVKEFKDKQNTLYVAISLEAIKKTEVSKQGTTENSVAQNSRSVTISIPNIFAKINPKDISFLKYIPNEFLSEEQIEAKNKAIKNDDIRYSEKDYTVYDTTAILKESTIDKYLKDYAAESTPNYAQAYITYMSPRQFLNLTTRNAESQYFIEKESKKLNRKEFEDYTKHQPIQLRIDHETGEVIGHEGRHRMVALSNENIYDVPVLLFDYSNKTSKVNLNDFTLKGQFNEYRIEIVDEAIPLSYANRDLIIEKFGTQNSTQKVRERLGLGETLMYSEKDSTIYDLMGENESLRKDYEKLKSDFDNFKQLAKLDKRITNGKELNNNQVLTVAGILLKMGNSKMDKIELAKEIKSLFTYTKKAFSTEELTWADFWQRAYPIAEKIIKESNPLTIKDDYAKGILRDLRASSFSLDETQKKEAKYIFGDHWNYNFIGNIKVKDDAPNIDTMWQEWSNLYPDVFDADIGNNKINGLYEVISSLRSTSETIDEYAMKEKTKMLAFEMYNQCWNVSTLETTADKYANKIKELKSEHKRMMNEVRDEYQERIESQLIADDIYYGRKIQELKEKDKAKYNEKLKAQREKQKELYRNLRDRKNEEIALAKEHGKDLMAQYKEKAERQTVMQGIMATTTSLTKKLLKNDKDSHIPEALKPVVANLINAIDYSSKQLLGMDGTRKDYSGTPTQKDIALDNTFGKVKAMADDNVTLKEAIQDALTLFENAEKVANNTSDGSLDLSLVSLDADLIDRIKSLIKSIDVLEKNYGSKFTLQQMELNHLKTLNATVKSINTWANNVDNALSMKHKARISYDGEHTVEENDSLGKRKQYIESVESFKNFFSWSNLLPVNAFKRLGETAMKYFNALRDAQDDLAFRQEDIINFTDKLFKDKHKEIRKWREEVKEFDLRLPNGYAKKVRMPVSYVMTLYCVAKQEDARRHLYGMDEDGTRYDNNGGGMTIAPFKVKKSLEVSEDIENTIMTESLIKQITSTLTDEQRTIADELQKFINEKGSEWCDKVSLSLYGIKKFDIENYFPITVSPNTIKVLNPEDKRQSIHFFSILNYGFTKSRNPNAKQSIEIGDIFDIFANHMSMAAIYSSYALPIFDIVRWYNYKGKAENGKEIGVITSIQKAFGKGATTYIGRLISDLNGQHESSRLGFVTKIFRNTKIAMVGNSLSVGLLQPTAYLKAMTKISPMHLLKSALYVKDFGAKKGVEKAKKWCGIALWKSRDNFDTDISGNVTTKMLHDENWYEKAKSWSLKGAGWMDEKTWGVLWNACEFDIRKNRKDLKVGSDEFYEEVANKLRDVIYETQVVDSPLTRSDLMRSPDNLAKMITMFGSEMTVAYNMVNEALVDANLDVKRNGKNGAFKRNAKNIAITLTAYTLTSAAAQILNTMVQLMRDDEDKEPEKIMKMYFSNFLSDWLIFGKIPYVKEALNYAQGYSSSRVDTLWLDSMFKSIRYFGKAFDGDEGYGEKAIKESLKSLSYLSGLPMYNQYRDAIATFDTFRILDAEDFKEMLDDIFN